MSIPRSQHHSTSSATSIRTQSSIARTLALHLARQSMALLWLVDCGGAARKEHHRHNERRSLTQASTRNEATQQRATTRCVAAAENVVQGAVRILIDCEPE